MGLLDRLKGVQRPARGATAQPPAQLVQQLLALGGPEQPYTITTAQNGDVVADWQVADASWRQLVGQAGLIQTYQLVLRLHPEVPEVRSCEASMQGNWSVGTGQIETHANVTRNGRIVKSTVKAHTPQGTYEFRFDAAEVRDPVRAAVLAAGWTWRPVLSPGNL